ncbi:polysaccharide lyase family protein [Acidobacteriota bacterium]
MRHKILLFSALVVFISPWAAGAGELAWEIGIPDDSYEEFAIAGNFSAYRTVFAQDVDFVVGTSDPAQHWPYIQPGPIDGWAQYREHPFRISFDLTDVPEGYAYLTIDLIAAHHTFPPDLEIDVNGLRTSTWMPRGPPTEEVLTDPGRGVEHVVELPFSNDLLRAGANTVTLTAKEESWLLYDAVSLELGLDKPDESDILDFRVRQTLLWAGEAHDLRQVMEITIDNLGDSKTGVVTFALGSDEGIHEIPVIPFGRFVDYVLVPEVAEPISGAFTLTVDGHALLREATVEPQRKWRIYIPPFIHTDLGHQHPQPQIKERQLGILDDAIEACLVDPDFIWNCEISWQVQNYREGRSQSEWNRLVDLMQQGRIGLHAGYMNFLTGLCSHEELARFATYAGEIRRDYGVPLATASITDVPSLTGAMPMILARSGIETFTHYGYAAPPGSLEYLRNPFWWEGPDGSRVLSWFRPYTGQIDQIGITFRYEDVYTMLPAYIQGHFACEDYPFDAILFQAPFCDNSRFKRRFADVAYEWNAKWAYPKFILCRDEAFFDYIRVNYGGLIPTVKGDHGGWWEEGAATSAYETALNRQNHASLPTAEKLWTFLNWSDAAESYPAETLRQCWDDVMWYDEHTWGSWASVMYPDDPGVIEQWKLKSAPAYWAARTVQSLILESLDSMAGQVGTRRRAVLVFNPLSFNRTDVARVTLSQVQPGDRLDMIDMATGKRLPAQLVGRNRDGLEYAFIAEGVPPIGYRLYAPLVQPDSVMRVPPMDNRIFESEAYRLTFDGPTGGLTSIYDKTSARELLDPAGPYRGNQYLYMEGDPPSPASHVLDSADISGVPSHVPSGVLNTRTPCLGPVFGRVLVRGQTLHTPNLESEIILYNDLKRVDIINRFYKEETWDKEAVYFAFPFNVTSPAFTFEGPANIINPATDMLDGACLDWFAVQHWVDVSGSEGGVTLATPDSPLLCLGGMTARRNLTSFDPSSGHIFAYVMNNYSFTNYKAGQGGDFTFRYSLTSHSGDLDPIAATRFGWSIANPLLTVVIPPGSRGPWTKPADSLCSLDADHVMVLALKKTEDGEGWIMRLWEVGGEDGNVNVIFNHWTPQQAWLADLVEEPETPLVVNGDTVSVPVKAHEIVTLRLAP